MLSEVGGEAERLTVLQKYHILDSSPEEIFDELTRLTALILEVPIALISIVDKDRQWFKSSLGVHLKETPREFSFCSHTIKTPTQITIVEDATRDPRFANNPFVTGEPHIRFYAGVPLTSPEGHALGTLCVVDKAPRRLNTQHEQALKIIAHQVRAQLELRRRVRELKESESELIRAKQAAERATQVKSEFLAVMSHEIRTPLNGVIGFTNLLLATELKPEQRSHAEAIRSSGEALLLLINDILDYSKIESGRIEIEDNEFSLSETVEETLDSVAPSALNKPLELFYKMEPGVPECIRGDQLRLRQILLNLVANAVKFTEAGEVCVRIKKVTSRLDGPGTLAISVRDTGIGIAPDAAKSLFQPFSQADASITRRYGGTGLGLTISKRLVNRMGGEISVATQLGRGSEFTFTIPLQMGWHEQTIDPELINGLRGKSVLIADSNENARTQLKGFFEVLGVAADVSETGQLTTQLLQGREYDLVFIDLTLPDIDGIHLGKRIRTFRNSNQLPLVLLLKLGCSISPEDVFQEVLTKPLRRTQLYSFLRKQFLTTETSKPAALRTEKDELGQKYPLRVLVAEDNALNRKLIRRMLEDLGFLPELVENGSACVQAAREQNYDVVLMDVHMPFMDGLEATRQLRRDRSSAYIIALTASAMEGDKNRCIEAGMNAFLSKPLKVNELRQAFMKYLQTRDA